MKISETWVNKTENYQIGDSGYYEPYTDNIKKLFASLQKEYGKCVSRMFNDKYPGKSIGWVFQKTDKYENTHEPFVKETWVTLFQDNPVTVTNDYHYRFLN